MTLEDIHAILHTASDNVLNLRAHASELSPTTAMAVGEAIGALMKAKALVARDIDDRAFGSHA